MKKTSKGILIGVGVIVVCGILLIGIGANYLYTLAIDPTSSKGIVFGEESDDVKEGETSGILEEADKRWLLEEADATSFSFKAADGTALHHYFLAQPTGHKWFIPVHGYTSNGIAMAPYAKHFYEMGYQVVIPDLRGHGDSEGDYIGMGWDERLDIVALIEGIVAKDAQAEIVLFGISMGGATVLNVSGESLPENVKVIIADCAYTSTWDQFSHQLKSLFKLPAFPMMHAASLVTKLRAGYWLGEGGPITQVVKATVPILFIHGSTDDFVPFEMMEALYEAAPVEKEKLIVEGAGHAYARVVAGENYWHTVDTFVKKYVD